MAKRYYVNGFLKRQGFKGVEPFVKQAMGTTTNNWVKGNIKIERKNDYGTPILHVKENGTLLKSFYLKNDENKEATIKEFENFIGSLDYNVTKSEPKLIYTDEITESLNDFELKLKDIRKTIEEGRRLDSTQQSFLFKHKII